MTNGLFFVCFFAVTAVVLSLLLKEQSPRFSLFLGAGAGMMLTSFLFRYLFPVLSFLRENTETESFQPFLSLLLKALGIGMLVGITSGVCRDLGEAGVADKVELCGRAVILYLSLPVLKTVLETVGEFLT